MTRLDYATIYALDTRPEGLGHGWIQWKGTNVCMDVTCICGATPHVDAEFFYYFRCPECDHIFAVGAIVKLLPLTPEQETEVRSDYTAVTHGGDDWETDDRRD